MKKASLSFALCLVFAMALSSPAFSAHICIPGEKTQVLTKGSWLRVTALRADGEKCLVHYDGYSSQFDEWVGIDRLQVSSMPIPAAVQNLMKSRLPGVGSKVQALWQKWLPAHIKQLKGESFLVRYQDAAFPEEWVESKRVKTSSGQTPSVGNLVEVLALKWLPAKIQEIKGEQWLIRYEGDNAQEWVGPDRYRW